MMVGDRYVKSNGHIYNDAMILLLHIVKHPNEYQSYRSLADATGIPESTVKRIIRWHLSHGRENCVLHYVAYKAGIIIRYIGKKGQILFARYADEMEQSLLRNNDGSPNEGQLETDQYFE
jgi:hypothetical protein